MITNSQKQKLRNIIKDPVLFSKTILKDDLWSVQEDILRAVADSNNETIAIKSCHGSGKTFIVSRIALWFLLNYPNSKVIITANSFTQLSTSTFKEVLKAYEYLKPLLPNATNSISKIELSTNHFLLGISVADYKPENLQGHHADNILVIIDEASGLSQTLHRAIMGITSAGINAKTVMIGNPNYLSGSFYDVFTKDFANTKTFSISAFDTPNFKDNGIHNIDDLKNADFTKLKLTRSYLIKPQAAYNIYRKLPKNLYKIMVLGQFPDQQDKALVSISDFEAALSRKIKPQGIRVIGVDVARFGNDLSVIYERIGSKVIGCHSFSKLNSVELANEVEHIYKQNDEETFLFIDDGGGGGSVVDILLDRDIECEAVNFGSSADNSELYGRKRAELIMNLKYRFESGEISMDYDDDSTPQLKEELISIEWQITNSGKMEIEKKDLIKARLGRSPDFSDALALAFTDVLGDEIPETI